MFGLRGRGETARNVCMFCGRPVDTRGDDGATVVLRDESTHEELATRHFHISCLEANHRYGQIEADDGEEDEGDY